VADFLLRLGDMLVASGAATSDVEASVMASASALGVPRTEVDVTFNAVTVTLVPTDGPPITQVRVVRQRAANYSRLADVHALVLELVDEDLSRREATTRLADIEEQTAIYPRWLVSVAWGVLAAAVTQFLGGQLLAALVAFGTTVVVDQLGRFLGRRGWPDFFLNVAGAFLVTVVAMLLVAADVPIRASLVVSGGIIVLLSGVALVATVQDAITGFLVTAAGRAMEVLLLSAGIVAGVGLGLFVGRQLGVNLVITSPVTDSLSDLPWRMFAAGVGSAAFAVALQSPRRLLLPSWLAGVLSFGTWFTMLHWFSAPVAACVAAVVAGLASHVLALRLHAPPLVVVIPSIVILLPGLTIYRGMLLLSDGLSGAGLVTMLEAITIGLALAAGVLLGEIVGQPVRRELNRVERRFGGPHLIGPQRVRLRRRRRSFRE
jgi:uncharacterized membrane protein YjjP (DUF1212 family)